MIRNVVCAAFLSGICAAGLAAQQTTNPTDPQTRNPQTSMTQADKNDKAQKVTISGCLGNAAAKAMGATASSAYSLNKLDFKSSGSTFDDWSRSHPGSSSSASATMGARPNEVALSTTANKVDLSKYVGQNVQVTGTISNEGGLAAGASSSMGAKAGSTASGTASTSGTTAAGSTSLQNAQNGPTIDVTSVKVISKDCNSTR